ncbi:MAG: 2Fe-2S iron-sulfur cluster binding domain-containing protein [Candidatus Sericytochromatia bacterium]
MLVIEILKSVISKKEKYPPYQVRKGSNRFKNIYSYKKNVLLDDKEYKEKVPKECKTVEKFKLKLNSLDKEFLIKSDKTLIQNSEDNGIELRYSCLTGGCGACKVKKISGQVDMSETNCLSDDEIDDNYILACIAYPKSNIILDI